MRAFVLIAAPLRTGSSPGQALADRKVQPVGAADPQALGGGIYAEDVLRIEAQADGGAIVAACRSAIIAACGASAQCRPQYPPIPDLIFAMHCS
jgi:hypothetical protein